MCTRLFVVPKFCCCQYRNEKNKIFVWAINLPQFKFKTHASHIIAIRIVYSVDLNLIYLR